MIEKVKEEIKEQTDRLRYYSEKLRLMIAMYDNPVPPFNQEGIHSTLLSEIDATASTVAYIDNELVGLHAVCVQLGHQPTTGTVH